MSEGRGGRMGAVSALVSSLGIPIAVLWWGWRDGWLLLLDWAPGPRAAAPVGPVPSVVSWAAQAFGGAVGWLPLLLAVMAAGAGAGAVAVELRADRSVRWPALAVATSAAVANPFVVTRLYAGHVGVLWAYALLFWLVRSVLRNAERPSPRGSVAIGLLWAACTAATVHAAAIAAVPVIAGLWLRHRRLGTRSALVAGTTTLTVATAATLLWVLPWLQSNVFVDPRGSDAAAAFLTRGAGFEAVVGAASGSGFWRPLPAGLSAPTAWTSVLLLTAAIAAIGAGRGWGRDARFLLWSTAAVGTLVAMAGHGPSAAAWSWLMEHVTLVAVHREPGKWSMLPVLAGVLLAALAVDRLHRRSALAGTAVVVAAAGLSVWVMVAVTQELRPSHFPASWEAAVGAIGDECSVAVLGDGAYVDPGFTDGRVVANPAAGFFGEQAVVSSDTGVTGLAAARDASSAQRWVDAVNGRYLAGGSGVAPEMAGAAKAGIGWVFVARPPDEPTLVADLTTGDFTLVFTTAEGGLWKNPVDCAAGMGEQ